MRATLINQNGNIKIKINGKIFNPQCFRSFKPEAESIKHFTEAGIRLMNIFPTGVKNRLGTAYSPFGEVWIGEGKYNWDNLRRQVDMFIENAPEAYFMLMLQVDTRDWFLEQNPDIKNSFDHFSLTAGCEKWRKAAAMFMCDMIDYLNKHYPEKVYGVMLCGGGTNEWYNHHGDYAIHGKYKQAAFENWSGDMSSNLPSKEVIDKTSWGILRHPQKDCQGIDYWRFLHCLTNDTIKYFAGALKKHTNRTLLTAVAQGYLMDYKNDVIFGSDTGLWDTLESDDIDIFISPASYWFRGLNSTSGIRFPVDSIKLHGKLYIHSLDNVTHLASDSEVGRKLTSCFCSHAKLDNIDESREYFKRETALSMSKGMGYWWFGMYPQWYNNSEMMSEIKKIQITSQQVREKDCRSVSEIAVFVDEDSNYHLDAGQIVTNKNVMLQPESLYRLGAPWDNFHMNDITHCEMAHEQYKLYIFLNLLAPQNAHIEMIEKLKLDGKSMLFLYAPGIIGKDNFSIEKMSLLAGINLQELKDSEYKVVVPKGKWNEFDKNNIFGYDAPVTPMFYTEDCDLDVIGRFPKSKKPAFVLKEREDAFDAWTAAGSVPDKILRELARKAGVFIYLESGDPVYMNKSVLGCFAHKSGKRTLNMPFECKLREFYSGEEYQTTKHRLEVYFKANEMKLFEIKHII
jgi:beta-galactosidase